MVALHVQGLTVLADNALLSAWAKKKNIFEIHMLRWIQISNSNENRMRNIWIGVFLYTSCVVYVSCQNCSGTESAALLKIKEEILDGWSDFNFSSWKIDSDCCQWEGVVCHSSTGAVIELSCDLGNGTLSPSVCSLNNLEELHMQGSHSEVQQRYIPSCIWYMTELQTLDLSTSGLQFEDPRFTNNNKVPAPRLTHLDLSDSNLTGMLPSWVGNLSQLRELTLSSNRITGLPESIGDLTQLGSFTVHDNLISKFPVSLGRLSNLVSLDATDNLISEAPFIGNLSQLSSLNLGGNLITHLSPSITSLSTLSWLLLDNNQISDIHPSFANMSGLERLTLSSNNLTDIELPISSGIFPLLGKIDLNLNNLTSVPKFINSCPVLYNLDLSDNSMASFEGFPSASPLRNFYVSGNRLVRFDLSASSTSFSFPNISSLDLSRNYLGSVSLGNISSLTSLKLYKNLLQSIPSESILRQRNLNALRMESNQLQGSIPSEISSLTRLSFLTLSQNELTGTIPTSFSNLTGLQYLTLAQNNLSGHIPNMRSNFSSFLERLVFNFSYNSFSGSVPEIACSIPTCGYTQKDYCITARLLDISHNLLTGDLSPAARCQTYGNSNILLLSHNTLEGPIPESFIWNSLPDINSSRFSFLDLSNNRLSGRIDSRVLTTSSGLSGHCFEGPDFGAYLDLSNNNLTGSVPEILTNCSIIQRLRLGNNNLNGKIPTSLGRVGQSLLSLSLRDNDLHGPLPSSLGNCSSLQVLDLSGNRLTGSLPLELLRLNRTLRVLTVAGNNLSGPFPTWITAFGSLQVLDFSYNNFDGLIPENVEFSHLTALVDEAKPNKLPDTLFSESISFVAKGDTFDLVYVLAITTYFGIAHNRFYGPVPRELGLLTGLVYLTLAGNGFNGSIPESFGELRNLDSLDLSNNKLSGRIPSTLSKLSRISYCNVSYNELSGPLPGGQLSTLDISGYIENPGLCGLPLPSCSPAVSPSITLHVSGEEIGLDEWLSIPAAGLGFCVGFMAMTFSYLVTSRLRFASFLWSFQFLKSDPVLIRDQPYGAYIPPH